MLFMANLWLGMAVAVLGQDADYRAINDRPKPHPSAVPQDTAAYLMVRINTSSQEQPKWRKKVEVFIRNDPQEPTMVGIEREF